MLKNLPLELAKAIANKETGLFFFSYKEGGFVRVALRDGKILQVDGSYGEGESEIGRLFLWGEGEILKKKLPKDYDNFIPKKEYKINGFLKILIEEIRAKKSRVKQEISINEFIFNGFLKFLNNNSPFLFYSRDEWIGFSRLIEKLSKSIKNSLILINDKYILFFSNEIDLIFSSKGDADFNKVDEENFFEPFEYKIYIFSPMEYENLIYPFENKPKEVSQKRGKEVLMMNPVVAVLRDISNNYEIFIKDVVLPSLKEDEQYDVVIW